MKEIKTERTNERTNERKKERKKEKEDEEVKEDGEDEGGDDNDDDNGDDIITDNHIEEKEVMVMMKNNGTKNTERRRVDKTVNDRRSERKS